MIAQLSRTKIGWLDIGVQTTNPKLSYFRKNSREGLERLGQLTKRGVKYNLDLIYGIPDDDPSGFLESVRTAIEDFRPTTLKLFRLKIYDGTPLHQMAKENQWEFDPKTRAVMTVPGFSREDLKDLEFFSRNTQELYSFLNESNWFGLEEKLRNLGTFIRFDEFSRIEREVIQPIGARWRRFHERT
jgi:radical SAM superfamily enzyme YgiQ (UPF0313 family)